MISGGRGNDLVRARGNVLDVVDCGPGAHDRARVDQRDLLSGCEKVSRR